MSLYHSDPSKLKNILSAVVIQQISASQYIGSPIVYAVHPSGAIHCCHPLAYRRFVWAYCKLLAGYCMHPYYMFPGSAQRRKTGDGQPVNKYKESSAIVARRYMLHLFHCFRLLYNVDFFRCAAGRPPGVQAAGAQYCAPGRLSRFDAVAAGLRPVSDARRARLAAAVSWRRIRRRAFFASRPAGRLPRGRLFPAWTCPGPRRAACTTSCAGLPALVRRRDGPGIRSRSGSAAAAGIMHDASCIDAFRRKHQKTLFFHKRNFMQKIKKNVY